MSTQAYHKWNEVSFAYRIGIIHRLQHGSKINRNSLTIYYISGENVVALVLNKIILNNPISRKYLLTFYRQIFKDAISITIYYQNNVFQFSF